MCGFTRRTERGEDQKTSDYLQLLYSFNLITNQTLIQNWIKQQHNYCLKSTICVKYSIP